MRRLEGQVDFFNPAFQQSNERQDDWGGTVGQGFTAYGLRFELRSNDPAVLAQAVAYAPWGWQPAVIEAVDIGYRLYHDGSGPEHSPCEGGYRLYCGAALVAHSQELGPLLPIFQRHAELLMALRAPQGLFVHAGAVSWQEQAILIPGRSFTGKSTLVEALVRAGATYYSDEFAILDQEGRLHPYPLPLSIRGTDDQVGQKTSVEVPHGQIGTEPLPVGWVIVTEYCAGARWRPRPLSPAQTLLALMDNAVAARREPQYTMPILRRVVLNARAIQSQRGEASQVARALLHGRKHCASR